MAHDVGFKVCEDPDCKKAVKAHRWGMTKAEGWFFTRDGKAYCPEHTPEWVEEWRKRNRGRTR